MTAYIAPGIHSPVEIICSEYNLTPEDLFRRSRKREIIECRYLVFNWYRLNTIMTYQQIGDKFGRYDHNTVRHGVQSIEDLTGTNKWFREKVRAIRKKCEDARIMY